MGFYFNQGDRPLSGYTIQRGVGRGGFGEVYYATSDGGKDVALKYLRENPQVELRGVQHCLNLKSPHLVAIHDIKENEAGDSFVIMEYVSGPSLRDLLNSEPGGLGVAKAAFFLREIGKGLAYLHDRGIVHRDLKPGNIFYEDGYVKIGDYGLAKLMASSQHSGQTVSVGTVHYMAPEVGSGNYDRTIDIYALGVMLYEMLLGKVPFSGATMGEVLMKHLTAQPQVDELPSPFPQVIRKALAKDPKDRYQTVQEMMNEIFAVRDISESVATMDSLSLTRMATAVAAKIRTEGGAGGVAVAAGSSNVTGFSPKPPPPPPLSGARWQRTPGAQVDVCSQPRWIRDVRKGVPGFEPQADFPQRYRITTGLLGLFLGPFGIHRFYTGYNTIGVFQILVSCFTGIGALWGIIEGIQILLNGNFRDAVGRPLLEPEWKSRPGGRSVVIRGLWGIVSLAALAASIATASVATFVEPEYSLGIGAEYVWNSMHGLYFVASAMAGLFYFAIWKASHRGGMGLWRSTLRPAAMALALAVAGAGLTFELALAAGPLQLVGYFAVMTATAFFLIAWLLRGPPFVLQATDAYWSRAWSRMFLAAFLVFAVGAMTGFIAWSKEGRPFDLHVDRYSDVRVYAGDSSGMTLAYTRDGMEIELPFASLDVEMDEAGNKSARASVAPKASRSGVVPPAPEVSDARTRDTNASRRTIRVASVQYSHRPMGLCVCTLLAVGCWNESRHRRSLAIEAMRLSATSPVESL